MIGNIGPTEIILILAVIVLLFGAKKIPDLAKGLGQGLKEFKKAQKEVTDDADAAQKKPAEKVEDKKSA